MVAETLLTTVCSQEAPVEEVKYRYATGGTLTWPEKTCNPFMVTVMKPCTIETM